MAPKNRRKVQVRTVQVRSATPNVCVNEEGHLLGQERIGINFFKNLWNKNLKGKATLIVAALIFIIAVITIPYAVITKQGDEGFLKTKKGHAVNWKRLPVSCFFFGKITPHQFYIYNKARREFNTRTGIVLLGPCVKWKIPETSGLIGGAVIIRVASAPKNSRFTWNDAAGTTFLYPRKNNRSNLFGAEIYIDPEYSENYPVWLHELGHVLGLAHDKLRSSVMYPSVQNRPGKLSDRDVEALKQMYSNRN